MLKKIIIAFVILAGLGTAVVLTLVLFILSRSITDVSVSSKNAQAVRAFSAAEAGIENALVVGAGSGGVPVAIGDATYSSKVTGFAEGLTDFNYPLPMYSGDYMTTWFSSHDANGNITCADGKCFTGTQMTVCWGAPGTSANLSTTPAIEVSVFYETTPNTPSTVQIKRRAVDPNSGRRLQNLFSADTGGTCPITGTSYAFERLIVFASPNLGVPAGSQLLFARIRVLYNSDSPQPVGVSVAGSGDTLPSQGQDVVSTGSAGDANRKVEVFQGWPEAPSVFDYAIYGTGLTK